MKNKFILLFIIMSAMVSFYSAVNAEKMPTKGLIVTELEKFSLAKQIPQINSGKHSYNIRARKIIIPAGVSIAKHEHSNRPGIAYVQSGEIIEYRGSQSRLLKAGDSLREDFTTIHSYKNISNEDCVVIAFDIPKIKNK
jgi:quercetin dioxygenase-like cupin family protein